MDDYKKTKIQLVNEVRQLREQMELIREQQDWIWSMNTRGVHTFSNSASKRLLGYPADDIVGTSVFPLIHPDDIESAKQLYEKSIREKCGWSKHCVRWVHRNGSIRKLESNAEPLLDGEGNLVGFSGIDRDVTSAL